MKIKYPRYHVTDEPTSFYVFCQESEESGALWSNWIRGDANLWYKLRNASRDEKQELITKLADRKYP